MATAASDASGDARCFLALLPDAASRDALLTLRATNADAPIANPRGVRWLDAASLHLTLRFLGATSNAQIEYLKHMLPTLVRGVPQLAGRRCAIWPNRARPRVLVLEVDAANELQALADDCEALARKCGFAADPRAFRAHLTLARLRPGCALEHPPTPGVTLGFATLALMASNLQASGARYCSLAEVALPARG